MHLQLILPIALVLILLAGCFAGLFWRLASRFDAHAVYSRMAGRLFSGKLCSHGAIVGEKMTSSFWRRKPGYRPEIAKRLMAERRKIFAAYLGHLVQDFNQLVGIGKLMIVYSTQDQQEFARRLWRQQVRFYAAVCSVRLRLALYPLGWSGSRCASSGGGHHRHARPGA